jgi:tetratricopeptide (TPR) repeat protein
MTQHTPLQLLLSRVRQLPQRSAETWQGGLFKLPMWVDNPRDPEDPHRPVAACWLSLRTGLIHVEGPSGPDGPDGPDDDLALRGFLEFGRRWARQLDGRPARVQVRDAALAAALGPTLAVLNTPVDVVGDLPALRMALRTLEEHASEGPRRPGLLEEPGVTPDRVGAFAEAAAAFYRARPWAHLVNEDLIVVESPGSPPGLAMLSVLGNGGREFGLAFHKDRRSFERLIDPATAPSSVRRAHGVTFGPAHELPFADLDAWEEHGWALAGRRAYPLPCDLYADGRFIRPTAVELTQMEVLLRALAETTEDELDAGRWQRRVTGFDGPVEVTLTLPSLLEADAGGAHGQPPSPRTVSRAAARASAQVGRFLADHEFESIEEASASLAQAHQAGLFDLAPEQTAGRPLTALEQAQELAHDAAEATGRLRIKLARRALAVSPDCADAWVTLGDAAASPEAALECYERGVEAGARALGPAFESHAGHFWGELATRPYMRARLALAGVLQALGRDEDATAHYREMLRLNPNDNQGVRHLLLPLLLERGQDEEAGRLLDAYTDDVFAIWRYGRALWLFRRDGDSVEARAALAHAREVNPHVPGYLSKPESMPAMPPAYRLGGREEAAHAADGLLDAVHATTGALAWIRRNARAKHKATSRRPAARTRRR